MNAKIQRVMKEMEKTRDKIGALQARLRDLEKQKTELENTEIISAVRGMDISLTELADMLKAASGQVGPNTTAQEKEDSEE